MMYDAQGKAAFRPRTAPAAVQQIRDQEKGFAIVVGGAQDEPGAVAGELIIPLRLMRKFETDAPAKLLLTVVALLSNPQQGATP